MTPTEQEEQEFIAAIQKNPNDDVIRGVFADWLDEHDHPERAEGQRNWRESKQWLIDTFHGYRHGYDDELEIDWEEIVEEVKHDYFTERGSSNLRDMNAEEFWRHWCAYTASGIPPMHHGGSPFSCSC